VKIPASNQLQFFLIANRHSISVIIQVLIYFFYFDIVSLDFVLCAEGDGNCLEAYKASLEDLKEKQKSKNFISKTAVGKNLDGNHFKLRGIGSFKECQTA
jgi:hypothetical protein